MIIIHEKAPVSMPKSGAFCVIRIMKESEIYSNSNAK